VGALIGFLSIPRPAESLRQVGAFFFVVVGARLGPESWRVTLDGRPLVVTTALDLVAGQRLRLKLVSQEQGRWLLQTAAGPSAAPPVGAEVSGVLAAFLSRGVPMVGEKLAAWSRWLGRPGLPSDKEAWAASLEGRAQGPSSAFAAGLEPWLAWQAQLELGLSEPPPGDDYWDLWNSRKAVAGEPWLAMALRWVHEGREDAGLLQAHWSPQAQVIDQWNLTASPADTPFRLEARMSPGRLELTWRFFREDDRRKWASLALGLPDLSQPPELSVSLQVAGPATPPRRQGSVDVEA